MENGLREVPHPIAQPLILGREHEQAQFDRSIEELFQRRGSTVLVTGEAGIGKTTLVRNAAERAAARGALVLTGTCYEFDLPAPYGVWRDVLKQYRSQSNQLDSAAPVADPFDAESASGAGEIHARVYAYLAEISARQPLVIILEDLQWTDEASLDFVRYGMHQHDAASILLVMTCRADDLTAGQPLYRFLPMYIREGRPIRLALRPLDSGAIAKLVGHRYPALGTGDAERLTGYLERYSEGNPFFAEELLGMLEYRQVVHHDGNRWRLSELPAFSIPPLVRQVVHARLERLSDQSLELLEVASIIGVEIPLDLWQAISEATDDVLASAIEEALRERVIEEASGATYRFRHALIYSVIYERTAFGRRRELHLRAADTLAARPNVDPGTVAHHCIQAGDPRAADWLIQAGRLAARSFALRAASANYERALEVLDRDGSQPADRIWLLCALAEANRFTDVQRALSYVNRAFEALDEIDDPAMRALCSWCRARIRGFHQDNVLDDLRQAAADFAALPAPEQDRILLTPLRYVVSQATLAQDLANYGQFGEALEHAREFLARNSTPASGADYIEFGNAYFGLALAQAALGDPDGARIAFEQSREYFQHTGNYQMVSNSLYWELSVVAQVYETEQPARRHQLRQAEIDANQNSELVQSPTSDRVSTSETAILDGLWDECRRSASVRLDVPASRVPSARKLAHLDWLQGHPHQAWEHIHSVIPEGPDEEPGKRFFLHRHELQWIAAELALDAGNLDLARRWIEAIERWIDWSGKISGRALPELLWSRYFEFKDDQSSAKRHALNALEFASTPRQPLWLLAAHRSLARLAHLTGDLNSAGPHLDSALAIATACAAPYELALTLVLQGDLLNREGNARGAQRALADARQIAERLDARPLLLHIDQLAPAPSRPAIVDTDVPFGLSPRELEVLGYVVQGLTDAAIAQQLSISPRTVGGHLQSIFNKTGTSSRTAVTALAFQHGIFAHDT